MDTLNILLLGINENSTRKQTAEARVLFDEIINSLEFNISIIQKIVNLLCDNNLPDINYNENQYYNLNKEEVYTHCIKWISELLSPTYIHSTNKKVKLEHGYHPKLGDIFLPYVDEINKLTPKTAIIYLLDELDRSNLKIKNIVQEINKI